MTHFLHKPKLFHTQTLFSAEIQLIMNLTNLFYSFDQRVFKEFLGKKLSARTR